MNFSVAISVTVGVLVAVGLALTVARAKRRRQPDIPEINKHPERLEEELDASNDA
jgi:hypothetical protein